MIQLSDHFTYRKLLRFTFPSIIMLVVTSIYIVIDGWFVSNFVGKAQFTALNFIFPYLQILGGVGFMFGTGGSALIGKTLGEKRDRKANEIFSMLVYVTIGVGLLLTILGIAFVGKAAEAMGARGELLRNSIIYGSLYLVGLPGIILQYAFQCLCSTAGKPHLGLWYTLIAGIGNIALDALFIFTFQWGLAGAAAASGISQLLGGIIPVIYFAGKNSSLLHLGRTKYDGSAMLRICSNGFSELLNNISMAIVSMLYNAQLLRYVGEDGVAAYGVLMYVNMIFLGIFIGYCVGVSPIISFHYGAQNHRELHGLLKKSITILGISSVAMFAAGESLARPLSRLYTAYDADFLQITTRAFLIYSFSFLFSGFAILGSSFFTALNNGLISALQSFLRTLVFQVVTALVFPVFWDVDGIWLSMVSAELLAAVVAFLLIGIYRKRYHY